MQTFNFNSFRKALKLNTVTFVVTFAISLIVSNSYPSFRDWIGWHVQHQLCQAAASGNTRMTKMLLLAGANPTGFNTAFSPIHFAARYGQTEVVRILLDEGVDVNSVGYWHQTPLMETVWGGYLDTAKLLLSRGADLKRVDQHSGTVLWQARLANQIEMVRLVMRYGGRNCRDAESVLSAAVENGENEIVEALLSGGIDPRDVTATHLVLPLTEVAAKNNDRETLKLLKQAGAK